MKGKRHVIEWIQVERFIVDSHVIPDSLLVAQMEVVVLMVRGDHVMAGVVLFLLILLFLLLLFAREANLGRWLGST